MSSGIKSVGRTRKFGEDARGGRVSVYSALQKGGYTGVTKCSSVGSQGPVEYNLLETVG